MHTNTLNKDMVKSSRKYLCTHLKTYKGNIACRRYLYAFSMSLTTWPIAFISRSVYASVDSISTFFTHFVVSLIKIARLPYVFSLAMILSIFELSFVFMGMWFKNSISLEFTIDKLSFELLPIIENQFASSRFEVVLKLAVVSIEAYLLLPTLSFKLIIFEFSLVYLFLIERKIFSFDEFTIFKEACVSSVISYKHSLSIGLIIPPLSLIKSTVGPKKRSFSILESFV